MVPTGVAVAIPPGHAGFVLPRSGLAARHGLTCLNAPGLIDSGYRGELQVILVNHDPEQDYTVHRGDRIAQLVIMQVEQAAFALVGEGGLEDVAAGERRLRAHGYMTAESGDAKKGAVMQSLVGMDAAFLSLETPTTPMHIGVALVLDPPEGTRSLFSPSTRYAEIRRVIEQRLHLIPPLRQRAVRVPFGLHHPVWVDDPDFDLDDHLSRASLPSPGGQAELDAFVAGVMSRQLDPDRPLWEMHVVEGLEGERTALVAKVHHAMLDGVSGASVLAAFLDLTPRTRVVELPPEWDPATAAVQHADAAPRRLLVGPPAGIDAEHPAGRASKRWRTSGCTTVSWRAAASNRPRASSPRRARRSTAPSRTASASPASRSRSRT